MRRALALAMLLAGPGRARVLARASRFRSFGGFDVSPGLATWSVRQGVREPRIVLQRLG
jgi:hypothetical protein